MNSVTKFILLPKFLGPLLLYIKLVIFENFGLGFCFLW
ncbi:unnamed protein product [Arabidopsis halleri]